MATRQPVLPVPQIPQAPRLAPVQPALQVPQGPLLTPAQPFSQVPLASDVPAPLAINSAPQQSAAHVNHQASVANQATRQPDNGPISSGPAERDQQRIKTIFDAIGTDQLLDLMASNSQDGPQIFSAKVWVRACAVKTSEPSDMVISKGPLWIAIFHAVRKALITVAIEITLMAEEDGSELLSLTEDKYMDFCRLYIDVLMARTEITRSIEPDQATQDIWASEGKKDILDQVIEKEVALAAESERESDSQSPSSGNEADMTIKVETSIQQTMERFDSLSLDPQPCGISTTITGPATPVVPVTKHSKEHKIVHYNSASGDVNVIDGPPTQLPSGVKSVLTLTLDHSLSSRARPLRDLDYARALRDLAAALDKPHYAVDWMSDADDSSSQSA